MIVKILGVLDVIASLMLLIAGLGFQLPLIVALFFSILLIIKGILFITSFASWFDILGGILLLISIWLNLPGIILIIVFVLIFQKGILSFLS
jgi:hypothetical protein